MKQGSPKAVMSPAIHVVIGRSMLSGRRSSQPLCLSDYNELKKVRHHKHDADIMNKLSVMQTAIHVWEDHFLSHSFQLLLLSRDILLNITEIWNCLADWTSSLTISDGYAGTAVCFQKEWLTMVKPWVWWVWKIFGALMGKSKKCCHMVHEKLWLWDFMPWNITKKACARKVIGHSVQKPCKVWGWQHSKTPRRETISRVILV